MLPKFEIDPTGAPPSTHRSRRRLVIVLLLVMAPITALAILWGVARARSSARLAKAIAQAEAMDPGRWRMADVWNARPTVPDAENGALIVERINAQLGPNWLRLPTAPGTPDEVARKALYDEIVRSEPTWVIPPDRADALRADLAALGPVLAEARSMADLPRGRFPVKPTSPLLAMPPPHIAAIRVATHPLVLDAVLRSADGDPDGSIDDVRAMLNVARSVGDEPIAVSQMVRMVLVGNALSTLQRVLAQGEPSDDALRRLDVILADEARQPVLEWAMLGERAGAFQTLDDLANGRVRLGALLAMIGARGLPPGLILPRSVYEYNSAILLDSTNEAVAISRRPIRQQPPLWAAWEGRLMGWLSGPLQLWATAPGRFLIPSARHQANRWFEYSAELAAARVLVAAERYRRRHRDWPASQADLVPDLLEAPLDDPLGPGPILLRRDADGLLVYSVGPDGQDDRGQTKVWKGPNTPAPTQMGGDVGYRLFDPLQRRRPAGRITPLPDHPFEPAAP